MTLTFNGSAGISGSASQSLLTNALMTPLTARYIKGGTFTVSQKAILDKVRYELPQLANYPSSSYVPGISFLIWDMDNDDVPMAWVNGVGATGSNLGPLSLFRIDSARITTVTFEPGKTYMYGIHYPNGFQAATPNRLVGGASSGVTSGYTRGPFTFLQAYNSDPLAGTGVISAGTYPEIPDNAAAQAWAGEVSFYFTAEIALTQTAPPDPVIMPGGQSFGIGVKKAWMPSQVKEWVLEYTRSPDGIGFWQEWAQLGVFPIEENVYIHSPLDPFDKPYYKYRYRVASSYEMSEYSEEAITPKVSSAITVDPDTDLIDASAIPPGSVNSGHINVEALSSITANVGELTAGLLRGPLIETSATNPRVYLQQGIGLQARDISGSTVFSLDATTGALVLKGAITTGSDIAGATITGGSVRTATSGARVVMDSVGLTAYHTDGVTKKLEFKTSDGSLSLTGAITSATITGSTLTGGTVQTASSGSRVVMTTAGLVGYATDGTTERFKLDTSTGLLYLNGASGTLAAGSVIDGSYIAASSVTTAKLTATAIDGMTVTGATVRTASSGARVEMTTSGLQGINSGGTQQYALTGATGLVFNGSTTLSAPQVITWKDPVSAVDTMSTYAYNFTAGGVNTIIGGTSLLATVASPKSDWLLEVKGGYGGSNNLPVVRLEAQTANSDVQTSLGGYVTNTTGVGNNYTIMNGQGRSSFALYEEITSGFALISPWVHYDPSETTWQKLRVYKLRTTGGTVVFVHGLIWTNGSSAPGAGNVLTGLPAPKSGKTIVISIWGSAAGVGTTSRFDLLSTGTAVYQGGTAVWDYATVNFSYVAAGS